MRKPLEFGYNILTEKKGEVEFDDELYQSGQLVKSSVQEYTDEALILQSILYYSIDYGIENYFKSRELSENHLLYNCEYYKKLYEHSKMKIESRKESMNPRIVNALNKLIYLELVDSRPFIAYNKEDSKEYRFTKLGRMILVYYCIVIKLKFIKLTSTPMKKRFYKFVIIMTV